MALKIPDAPGIVGSDIELRSPQMVSPVSNTPQFKVDLSGLQDSVGNVSKYYQGMIQDQTNTYMTDLKNEYLQHMRSYQDDVFQKHQGRNARDLYAQFIKKESDKWLENKFGAPKDDGQIRLADKELQAQLTNWVGTQQPHFINSTANYEEREWDAYRKTVFTARDNIAANLMLNATSKETIQNAIDGFRQNTYEANPGMDKDFIEQAIAGKVDTSLVAYLNKKSATDPMGAWREMNTVDVISGNMTDESKKQVLETIRKSYKTMGTDEFAHSQNGEGGSSGMVNNVEAIKAIFGEDEADEVRADMIAKGNERAAALRKAQAGQHELVVNTAMNKVLSARDDFQLSEGLRDLYAADEKAALNFIEARDAWVANQQDIETAGYNTESRIEKIEDRMKSIGESMIQDKIRSRVYGELRDGTLGNLGESQTVGMSDEMAANLEKISGIKGLSKQQDFAETVTEMVAEGQPKGAWRSDVKDSDLYSVIDSLVDEEGELNRPRIEAAARIWKTSTRRQNQMPRYKELATKISNGEMRAYDAEQMAGLDYPIQMQLSTLIENNNKYIDTKNDLKNAGVDLDSIMQTNGVDTQYKNLDVGSQNLLKRNIVYEVNAAKARNGGMLPDKDAVQGIVLRVQKNSISPMMALLQDTSLAENMPAENLTNDQRLELSVRESLSWDKNKPSKRGLEDQLKRAESTVDRISNSSRLNRDEQQYVKQNKAYLVSLYQAGDLAGMVNFMALATQGGF